MSQENVAAVHKCVDALNRRHVDGYLACCTEQVQLIPATAPIEGSYTGRSGIRRFFADVAEIAPDFRLAIKRVEAAGHERVVCFERGRASGRSSGVSLDQGISFGTVYDFAEGRIERIRVFTDREQALEAAGLRE